MVQSARVDAQTKSARSQPCGPEGRESWFLDVQVTIVSELRAVIGICRDSERNKFTAGNFGLPYGWKTLEPTGRRERL